MGQDETTSLSHSREARMGWLERGREAMQKAEATLQVRDDSKIEGRHDGNGEFH